MLPEDSKWCCKTIPSRSMPLGVASPFLLLGLDGADRLFLFLSPFLPPPSCILCLFDISLIPIWSPLQVGPLFRYLLVYLFWSVLSLLVSLLVYRLFWLAVSSGIFLPISSGLPSLPVRITMIINMRAMLKYPHPPSKTKLKIKLFFSSTKKNQVEDRIECDVVCDRFNSGGFSTRLIPSRKNELMFNSVFFQLGFS